MNKDFKIDMDKDGNLKFPPLEIVDGSSYCQFSVVENKLAALSRNQEKIYFALHVIMNSIVKVAVQVEKK